MSDRLFIHCSASSWLQRPRRDTPTAPNPPTPSFDLLVLSREIASSFPPDVTSCLSPLSCHFVPCGHRVTVSGEDGGETQPVSLSAAEICQPAARLSCCGGVTVFNWTLFYLSVCLCTCLCVNMSGRVHTSVHCTRLSECVFVSVCRARVQLSMSVCKCMSQF